METKQHELFNYDGTINTFTGKKLSFISPKPEQIDAEDIAHGLAFKGHFAGQTLEFFSIAEHSLLVKRLIPRSLRTSKLCIAALLHDGSEAYTGDMVKPLKLLLPEFNIFEERLMNAISAHFGIDEKIFKSIKQYDILAQQIEFDYFYRGVDSQKILCLPPDIALEMYSNCLNDHLKDHWNEKILDSEL